MSTTTADVLSPSGLTSTTLFAYLIVPALLLWVAYYRMSRRRLYDLANKIPGPEGLPLFGKVLDVIWGNPNSIFEKVLSLAKEYDNKPLVKFWFGPRLFLFLKDPRDIEIILSSHVHIDKSPEYSFFKPWLGNGLLISTGHIQIIFLSKPATSKSFSFQNRPHPKLHAKPAISNIQS
uniref:Cytochrome P450 4g15 n=1 Tax=Cacopsylla melanoneura TaxID=428564 RepID=A0A8D9EEA6_9HEMI